MRRSLLFVTAFALASVASAATLSVTVLTANGKAMAGAIVTAQSLEPASRPAPVVRAAVSQTNLAFVPDLLIVPVGSSIDFPNNDSVGHQIYSFSPAKRFQLPLYRGKPYPPVRFDQPGLVTLGCNIHDAMLAYIVVTDAPFFGRTDSAGAWSTEVPRGKYRIAVWHPRLRDEAKTLEREVTVGAADRVDVALQLSKPLKPAPLGTHPHSWDAY
jgi:plastocyanin